MTPTTHQLTDMPIFGNFGLNPEIPIGFIGTGQIAWQSAARALRWGFKARVFGRSEKSASEAKTNILGYYADMVGKDLLSDSLEIIARENLRVFPSIDEHLAECGEFVVEALLEDLDVKQQRLALVDALLPENTVIGSATSSLVMEEIAEALTPKRRLKFVGWHPMNPVHTMNGGELIAPEGAEIAAVRRAYEFARQLRMEFAIMLSGSPGHFVNRLMFRYIVEAYYFLQENLVRMFDITTGELTIPTIRQAMAQLDAMYEASTNQPVGPFRLAEEIVSLPVTRNIAVNLHQQRPDHFLPCPELLTLHAAGRLDEWRAAA